MGWKAVVVFALFLGGVLFWAAWDLGSGVAIRFADSVTGALK